MDQAEAVKAWSELNGAPFDFQSDVDRAALFLLLAPTRNNSLHRVALDSDLTTDECRTLKRNAIDNGIFVGRRLAVDWLDTENGAVAFIMDAMCVAGVLQRTSTP